MCAALTLLYCLVLYDGWRQLFRDSDTGWHIRAGEQMLNSHTLPYTDPYSFSRANAPWIDWEWGADVCMGLTHRVGGPAAVAVLFASIIAMTTWLWWQLTWTLGGDFLVGWLLAVPMLSTTNLHWLARPHIFSWSLALLALILIESGVESWIAVALLSVVWVNVHASFFLLPVMLLLYAAGEWISYFFFADARTPRTRWLVGAAFVAIVSSLLNPYGFHVHKHVFEYLSNSELIDRIGEFQSFNFHAAGAGQILAGLGAAALGGVLALTQGRVSHFLMAALFLALGLRSARGLPLVALLILPLANRAVIQALRETQALKPALRKWLSGATQYSGNLRKLDQRQSGLALVPLIVVCLVFAARSGGAQKWAGFPPSEYPVEAVKHLPPDARVLAPDMYGGYLIYRFNGERKVYFDGRSDFYGIAFMKNYIELVEVRPNWLDEFERQHFTHALLPVRYSLVPALLQKGWRRLYNDEVATVLVK